MTTVRPNSASNPLNLPGSSQVDSTLKGLLAGKDFNSLSTADLFKAVYGESVDDAAKEFGIDLNHITPESLLKAVYGDHASDLGDLSGVPGDAGTPASTDAAAGTDAAASTDPLSGPKSSDPLSTSTFDNILDIGDNYDKLFASSFSDFMPVETPDSLGNPSGLGMKDQNTVVTSGGYEIKVNGQSDWTITGPDGKSTHIWGDPHVDESDGGKWQFKKPTTFILGDGTKINVSVGRDPKHPDATVTTGLDIINGENRVDFMYMEVPGQGTCNTGVYTNGREHQYDTHTEDTVRMGDNTADWTFNNKEITGSKNSGATLLTGKAMQGAKDQPNAPATNSGNSKPPTSSTGSTAPSGSGNKTDSSHKADHKHPHGKHGHKHDPIKKHGGPEQWSKKIAHDVVRLAKDLGVDKLLGNKAWGELQRTPWEAMGLLRKAEGKEQDAEKSIHDAFRMFGDMFRVLQDREQMSRSVGRHTRIQG